MNENKIFRSILLLEFWKKTILYSQVFEILHVILSNQILKSFQKTFVDKFMFKERQIKKNIVQTSNLKKVSNRFWCF